MSAARELADYAVLVTVRKRRGLAMEDALREHDAALARAVSEREEASALAAAAEVTLADYAARLAQRTAASSRVRIADLESAKGHRDVLSLRHARTLDAVRIADDSVIAAEGVCAAARRKIAVNEDRISTLRVQRKSIEARVARDREEREDDERADSMGRRMPAARAQ